MSRSLIIVESPAKIKTIRKYLPDDFEVAASVGHVKDLPKNVLGIDVKKGFEPTYQVIDTKKKVIADLKKAAKKAENIYLAPDPDREGEAIAWHIAQEIGGRDKTVYRVLFNDLTKNTVLEALKNPLSLDMNKFEAQQTRRILDRLVGYKISPLLWDKVKRGLSAGRVQSVAVRLICDREREILAFVPDEYWNITALLRKQAPTLANGQAASFEARLFRIDGKKARVTSAEEAEKAVAEIEAHDPVVARVERKEVKRNPPAPFTTSKLQQEASRWHRFPAKKTMSVAQRLYEGVELGKEGSVGLITYMRTDSVRVADEALKEVRAYIAENYDPAYLPSKARAYKVSGSAQDAHEAIRPASMAYRPQDIRGHLTDEQFKLYSLIWNRFVASQMNPAVFDQTIIDVDAGRCQLRAQGLVMKFPGFTTVYTEGKENGNGNGNGEDDSEDGRLLPDVAQGETLNLVPPVKKEQKFTQPPPRFSEASLVKELEEKGIGRPSTYATILSTIQERDYVRLEKGRFSPTELGMLVTDLLVKNFPRILDVAFTASMENELDGIEEGKSNRLDILQNFYSPFEAELKQAGAQMRRVKGQEIPTDIVCDKCQSPMVIKWGKNGEFLACSNYPACRNTTNFSRSDDGQIVPAEATAAETGKTCDKCGKPMILKQGRFGPFLACSGYPECKNTVNPRDEAPPEEGAESAPAPVCEKCGKPMVTRRGRFGPFLGCSGYPECKNIVRQTRSGAPVAQAPPPEITDIACEKCGKPMAIRRGRFGRFLGCTGYPACKNIQKLPPQS
ncbi:MAG TPA: type I DNA topoisomerase [Syntrophales bacterium]|nr:type I DNA topoisomerase [Syntrophales bacterium]